MREWKVREVLEFALDLGDGLKFVDQGFPIILFCICICICICAHSLDGKELEVAVRLTCTTFVAGIEECEQAAVMVVGPGAEAFVGCF